MKGIDNAFAERRVRYEPSSGQHLVGGPVTPYLIHCLLRRMWACCDAITAPGDLWELASLLDDCRRLAGYSGKETLARGPKAKEIKYAVSGIPSA